MIIIELSGGLGNQLTVYSLYLRLKNIGKNVKLDPFLYDTEYECKGGGNVNRELELDKLGISYVACTLKEHNHCTSNHLIDKIMRHIGKNKMNSIPEKEIENMKEIDHTYITGPFSSPVFIEDVEQDMGDKICFIPSDNSKNVKILEEIKNSNSVGIHIRRTDYLEEQNKYLNIATEEYYATAIEYIKKKNQDAVFYIFSDDKEYINTKYKEDTFRIVDWNTDDANVYDMQLMSECKHNITAKSTFSQWAARLNTNPNKIITAPIEDEKEIRAIDKNFTWINKDGIIIKEA